MESKNETIQSLVMDLQFIKAEKLVIVTRAFAEKHFGNSGINFFDYFTFKVIDIPSISELELFAYRSANTPTGTFLSIEKFKSILELKFSLEFGFSSHLSWWDDGHVGWLEMNRSESGDMVRISQSYTDNGTHFTLLSSCEF